MAWVCSSCGVRNATNSGVCRWCGKVAAQPQPPQQQPVVYQPTRIYPPPQVYYPQQQSGPMAGYPLQPSVINDLRAMGGCEAAKLTFGASMGAGFGWRIGQMLGRFTGCLLVIFGIAILAGVVGMFAAHGSRLSENSRALSTSNARAKASQRAFDARALDNCIATTMQNTNAPMADIRNYCTCALREWKATGLVEQARQMCSAEVLQGQVSSQNAGSQQE